MSAGSTVRVCVVCRHVIKGVVPRVCPECKKYHHSRKCVCPAEGKSPAAGADTETSKRFSVPRSPHSSVGKSLPTKSPRSAPRVRVNTAPAGKTSSGTGTMLPGMKGSGSSGVAPQVVTGDNRKNSVGIAGSPSASVLTTRKREEEMFKEKPVSEMNISNENNLANSRLISENITNPSNVQKSSIHSLKSDVATNTDSGDWFSLISSLDLGFLPDKLEALLAPLAAAVASIQVTLTAVQGEIVSMKEELTSQRLVCDSLSEG